MKIKDIKLLNFRNFDRVSVPFGSKVNVFLGENGQGKTNLLEAIYILTKGNSFRPALVSTLINKVINSQQAFAKMNVIKSSLTSEVKFNLENNKKSFFINNKKVTSKTLIQSFPSIIFSPESLAAIKDGPEQRRLLVDEWLVVQDLKNAQVISDFKKSLKQRNRLLKDYRQGLLDADSFFNLKSSIDEIYFQKATLLTLKRIQAIKAILADFAIAMKSINNGLDVDIAVDYLVSDQSANNWSAERISKSLTLRANELQRAEQDSGLSLVGPHKHDIKFLMNGEDSRYFCSQGQQRALILSFKMAQIISHYRIYNDYPLLLLDDVLSELDQQKRTHLVSFLKGIDAQIFITTTDLSFRFDELDKDVEIFKIEKGEISPVLKVLED